MEKLVEEIADGFREMDINEYEPYQLESKVRSAITRIGKAYADGELELPGEVGRKDAPHNADVVLPMAIRRMVKEGARGFIAVRKEEGE